jgi:predicted O-methyltransferase YrrM
MRNVMSDILAPGQEKYISSFRRDVDPLIQEMEIYAAENKVPILSWQSADLLEILIKAHKPKRVLELGTAIAYSSIRIARNLKKKGMLHTIEKSKDNIKVARKNIKKADLEEKIEILVGDALNIMPGLEKKYDFIFLDADKEDYKKLFDYSLVLLKRNGVLFVDNLLWHGYAAAKKVPPNYQESAGHIREFNHMFFSQKNLKTVLIPVGDGIGIGIRE